MSRPRIAIACPGIGRVRRGFERFFADLHAVMRADHDITLFKGGGPAGAGERVPPSPDRNGRLHRVLPLHALIGRTPFHTECLFYALAMLPALRGGGFDIVHTIDAPLTRLLYRLRARLGLRFTLLYTDGAGMAPSDYPPADFTHQIAPDALDRALAFGHAPDRMRLIPCGIHPEAFAAPRPRAALRREHGISDKTFVILSVAALNRDHKRTDYLIDEVAALDGDVLLLLDGSTSHGDPSLIDHARARLGPRCRVGHVASERVPELYALADIMAHAALWESFGLAVVEAASTGLPVLAHDSPHFRWLLPNPASHADMRAPGALAARLRPLIADRAALAALRDPNAAARFSWSSLKPAYAALYDEVAHLPRRLGPESECRKPEALAA